MNNAAVNVDEQRSPQDPDFNTLGRYPEVRLPDHLAILFLENSVEAP